MCPFAHVSRRAWRPESMETNVMWDSAQKVFRRLVPWIKPEQHAAVFLAHLVNDTGFPAVFASANMNIPKVWVLFEIKDDMLVQKTIGLQLVENRKVGSIQPNVVDDDARELFFQHVFSQFVQRVQEGFQRAEMISTGGCHNGIRVCAARFFDGRHLERFLNRCEEWFERTSGAYSVKWYICFKG